MEKDKYKTKVIFRKFRGGDIVALFPEHLAGFDFYECQSYMHIGQHGAADIGYTILITEPCNPDEYASLQAELEILGYDLDIKTRYTKHMRDNRLSQLDFYRQLYMETLADSTEVK